MKNLQVFKDYICACYPQEACGIIQNNEFIPVENNHNDPLNYFSFPLEITQELLLSGEDYYIIHSHTMESFSNDPRVPSIEDMEGQRNSGKEWGIVHCDGDNVTEILWFGKPSKEDLLGRIYIPNVYDCFTLARDFIFRERGIDVGTHPRPANWEEWNPHYIEQTYQSLGFIDVKEPKYGDILLFSIGSRWINHIGIYTKEDTFIHHLFQRKSSEDSLKKWQRQLYKIIRLSHD